METLAVFIEVLLFYLIIKTTFRLFMLFRTAKKVKEQAINVDANKAAEPVKVVEEMVCDEICGSTLPRSQSYILVKNDQEYYFCSWDCRQKFLDDDVVLEGAGSLT